MTTRLQPVSCATRGSHVPGDGPLPMVSGVETRGVLELLAAGVIRLVDTVFEWNERDRQRRHLMSLDDQMLRDIGVSRTDAAREGRKPFWQA